MSSLRWFVSVLMVLCTTSLFAVPGDPDGLDANVTGTTVQVAVTQADGKILLGGNFSSVHGVARSHIARLNADGTLDAGFDPKANDEVRCIALQDDGKILIGGTFTTLQPNGAEAPVARSRFARLNPDGSLDTSLSAGVNGAVLALCLQADGKLLLGGAFTNFQPHSAAAFTQRFRIARMNVDGTLDSGFDPKANSGEVRSIVVQPDKKVLLAGTFTQLQPNGGSSVNRSRIARVNEAGTVDSAFNPSANSVVDVIALQADGSILLGGAFTQVGSLSRSFVARINSAGSGDSTFNPRPDARVYGIAVQADQRIVIGGVFTTLQPVGATIPVSRGRVAMLLANGTLAPGFDPATDGPVYGVSHQSEGKVLVSGAFGALQSNGAASPVTRLRLARVENASATSAIMASSPSRVWWSRGSAAPDAGRVAFDLSEDGGETWSKVADASRIGSTANWEALGLTLPSSGMIRARGTTTGGLSNASQGMVVQMSPFSLIPDIRIEHPDGSLLTAGSSIPFGDYEPGSNVREVIVRNTGNQQLDGLGITMGGDDAALFQASGLPAGGIAPGGMATVSVTFQPVAEGTAEATMTIVSDDPDEGSIELLLTGSAEGPDLVVETPPGTVFESGSTLDLGEVQLGARVSATVRLRNDGDFPLTGIGALLDGANAAEFDHGALPSLLEPGAEATFELTFSPMGTGEREATLHISSNDASTPDFGLILDGSGGDTVTASFDALSDVILSLPAFDATGLTLGPLALGFSPVAGTQLRIVDNTGPDPITGTFANLAEGATVTANFGGHTISFTASYTGGDGNDLVLTAATSGGQFILFPEIPAKTISSVPFALAATAYSGLPVTYEIVAGAGIATLAADTVTLAGTTGTVTVRASQGGGNGFDPAEAVYRSFTVMEAKFVAISTFWDFGLALRSDGSLWAWGSNEHGQLADGTTDPQDRLVRIGTQTDWAKIAAGGHHAVAIKTDGTLWLWGMGGYDAEDDGLDPPYLEPVQVGSDSDWSEASGAYGYAETTFLIKEDGTLWILDTNSLAAGNMDEAPEQVGSSAGWVAVSSGDNYHLALKEDGTLWAMGSNDSGQLGDGTTTMKPNLVQVGSDDDWAKISTGYNHSLGIKEDGSLWAWGANDDGKLGDGTETFRASPVRIGDDTDWSSVSGAFNDTFATKADGTLWAWGLNEYGTHGDGTREARLVPTRVGDRSDWTAVDGNYYHTVGLTADGALWFWGQYEDEGVIHPPDWSRHETLSPVTGGSYFPVKSAASGVFHTLIVGRDGTLRATGKNGEGQLGDGTTHDRSEPVAIGSGGGWSRVNTGYWAGSFGVKDDGTLWEWGNFFNGDHHITPDQIGTESDWSVIAANWGNGTIALKTDGTLWRWPDGGDELQPLGEDADWAAVATTNGWPLAHHYALKQDGTLWSWSWPPFAFSPEQVGTDHDWAKIVTSGWTLLALKADGTLWEWSQSAGGQLVQVGGDDWVDIASTPINYVGLKRDGSLWAWGNNEYGQLGDGTTVDRLAPQRIGTSNAWQSLVPSQGYGSILAIARDESLWGIGWNGDGKLGAAGRKSYVPDRRIPGQAAQTVSLTPLPAPVLGIPFTVSATVTSGLPVRFGVSGPATIEGDQVTVTGQGSVSVVAWQEGDANWLAAEPIYQTVALPAPYIRVERSPFNPLASGAAVELGVVVMGSALREAFMIRNLGEEELEGISLSFAGEDAALFSVSTAPAPSIPAGGSTLFRVRVAPDSPGIKSARVEIASNDPEVNPFVIHLTGSGKDTIEAEFVWPTDIVVSTDIFTATGVRLDTLVLGFSPTAGDRLTLVESTGVEPISGILDGLPEGAVVSASHGGLNHDFTVTYQGGDGNDLVLVFAGSRPILAVDRISPKDVGHPPFQLPNLEIAGIPVIYEVVAGGSLASLAGRTVSLSGNTGGVTIRVSWPGAGDLLPAVDQYLTFPVFVAFEKVAARRERSHALRNDGTLWSWGDNMEGELGDGSGVDQHAPVQIGGSSDWADISAGYRHTIALKEDGTLWTWGDNDEGQLGDGTTQYHDTPSQVGTASDWEQISGGGDHTLAIKSDGSLWAWGGQSHGQLGDGTTDSRWSPVRIGTDTDWQAISAGGRHSVAIKEDGTLWTWGSNGDGQLGDGSGLPEASPKQLGLETSWTAVSAGNAHTLALRSDGSMWAWGSNQLGQLGDGTLDPKNSPVQVGTDSDWAGIDAGNYHSLGWKSAGSLWSWGNNQYGQLGDGNWTNSETWVNSSVPVRAGDTVAWAMAVTGSVHSVGLGVDGSVWTWGYNGEGALGTPPAGPVPEPRMILPVALLQQIDFPTVTIPGFGMPIPLAATATSGLPIRYEVSGPAVIHGSLLTITGPGDMEVRAWQDGDATWLAADPVVATLVPGEPDIVIESDGGPLSSADIVTFGEVATGSELVREFTIANPGTAPLNGIAITISGVDAEAFSIVGTPSPDLAISASAAFSIAFSPSSDGEKQAVLEIASSDPDEGTFFLQLTGTARPAEQIFDSWSEGNDLAGDDALPDAVPFGDGVSNLLKYAFNMNGSGPDVSVLVPGGGTSGLPSFVFDEGGAETVLRLEFLRRRGSGLIYTPKVSATLEPGSFVPMSGDVVVVPIDEHWERVLVEEPRDFSSLPTGFGIVEVSLP
ncbi:choice-of-anchor D domain-containing protein [Luteolibacter arcticus]|uniref:Choice-of-anchor D domain-containing protein n=1 Tax=Luteolibacter arcticus TaxID=1581411 RepID=A0ABT3GCC1_9BACT|nr:choice-of-anchor D domain-containing protein [Luteolibacter arcticus]MCW1921278.1 choice-of-anchor D domain-containing protein [Luteolibacter arcticus]